MALNSKQEKIQGVICFTNAEQLPFIIKNGIYGNVSGNASSAFQFRFGMLKDLLSVKSGYLVFLFERGKSILHGVWKVDGEPYIGSSKIFDRSNTYPFRFKLQPYLQFLNPLPVTELRKLLDNRKIWTLRSFERDVQGPFASINPIAADEVSALLEYFL